MMKNIWLVKNLSENLLNCCIDRFIALEKQTKVSDFPTSRPGPVKQFMRDIDSEKSAKDLLQDTSGSRKRKYLLLCLLGSRK